MNTEINPSPAYQNGGSFAPVTARRRLRFTWPGLLAPARIVYLTGLVVTLLVTSSVVWIPLPLLKLAVFCAFLLISAVLWILGGGMRDLLRTPGSRFGTLAILALPAVYALSWWYSADRSMAFIGVGNEVDTFLFVTLGAIAFLLGSGLFRTMRSVRQLLRAVGIAVCLAALFQYVSILAGGAVLPAVFGDKSVNVVGKWNDFGILMSLGVLFLLIELELGGRSGWRWYASMAGLVLLGLLLALVQFNVMWWIVLGAAVIIGIIKFFSHTAGAGESPEGTHSRIPWCAGAVVLVCAAFLIAGGAIAARLPGPLSIPSLEVRPALGTTLSIAQAAHPGFMRTLLGSGPNTFLDEWIVNKPVSVNQTPFWSIDFDTGYSVWSTAFVSVGLVGTIAWLIPLVLVLLVGWRLRNVRRLPSSDRTAILSLVLAGVALWLYMALYADSQDILLAAFVLAGALWGVAGALRYGFSPAPTVTSTRRLFEGGVVVAALVLIIATAWLTVDTGRQFLSYVYEQQASQALSSGNIITAAGLDDASQRTVLTGDNLRLGISIDLSEMQTLASASSTPATINAMRQQFQSALQAAILQGEKAIQIHPRDYQAYAALGSVYGFLVPLKVQGAYESGQAAYIAAMGLSPRNPTLPLLLARLEATEDLKGNLSSVESLLNQSLALKPDYTDALLFAEQLAASQNDLPTATRAAEAAVASSPQDPTLWFQLGLFLYTGQDYADATTALQHAVALQPGYANAMYFLGLSEYKTGNTSDAIKQFSSLALSNPGNTEVALILSNMQAGKDPFAGEQPPQPPPQARTKAPIKQ